MSATDEAEYDREIARRRSTACVLVLPHRAILGFPDGEKNQSAPHVDYRPLVDVLSAAYPTDAHFCAYHSEPWLPYRLRLAIFDSRPGEDFDRALAARKIEPSERRAAIMAAANMAMVAWVGDVDDPIAHQQQIPARDEWRAAERQKFAALQAAHPGFRGYESRGGWRPFTLIQPRVLSSLDDVAAWRRYYLGVGGYLSRRFGIEIDPSCADPTRLFRVPYATRDCVLEQRPIYGDLRSVGMFDYSPTEEDYAEAARLAASNTRWRVDREAPIASDGSAPPMREVRQLGEGIAWDLKGEPVQRAIELIATNMPPVGNRHTYALILSGMLRRSEATEADAREIIYAAFCRGGSRDPTERAKVVSHTWGLSDDAPMLGYTAACALIGDAAAQEIGDCFTSARNHAWFAGIIESRDRRYREVQPAQAPTQPIAPPPPPPEAPPATRKEIRSSLLEARRKAVKKFNSTSNEWARQSAIILDRALSGRYLDDARAGDEMTVGLEGAELVRVVGRVLGLAVPANADAHMVLNMLGTSILSVVEGPSEIAPIESALIAARDGRRVFRAKKKIERAAKKVEAREKAFQKLAERFTAKGMKQC